MPRALLLPLALLLLAAAPAEQPKDATPTIDFGVHQPRDPDTKSLAGIESLRVTRENRVVTSRLFGPDEVPLGTLRISWPGDGSSELELTYAGRRYGGTWAGDTRRLVITDLEHGGSVAARYLGREAAQATGPHRGKWQLEPGQSFDRDEEQWWPLVLKMGQAYAETVTLLSLWAWE